MQANVGPGCPWLRLGVLSYGDVVLRDAILIPNLQDPFGLLTPSDAAAKMSTTPATTLHDHDSRAHPDVAPAEIAVGVMIGRASEYFDFFVFGIASALVFPEVYFSFAASPYQGTMYAFMVFALAFIARPFGTVLGMNIQRRWGRGVKLTSALFLLGTATAGIAFLPSYAKIGTAAIVLLMLLRLLQGLAQGASWDGLTSLLALHAPKERRGWYAMLGQLGAPLGFVVAACLYSYLSASLTHEDFIDWGWRYPFFAAFAINVVALFARLRLVVAKEYEQEMSHLELEPVDVAELWRERGRFVVIGAFASLASYALFHVVTIFPISWVRLFTDESVPKFLLLQAVGGVISAGGIVASGLLADRIGRTRTLGTLAVAIAIFSILAPTLVMGGGVMGQVIYILVGFLLLGLSYGQASGTAAANLGQRYRYTGAALSSDMAWLIGAAFAPLVALGLAANFGLPFIGLYLLSGAVATLIALNVNRRLSPPRPSSGG